MYDNVDSHRECLLLREFQSIVLVHSLVLPTIAQIGVVAKDGHEPPLIVEQTAIVCLLGIFTLPGDAVNAAHDAEPDVRHLRLGSNVVKSVKNRMLLGQ